MHLRSLTVTGALGLAAVVAASTFATPITFNGSSGTLSASATFDSLGTNLKVTLTNTSTADVLIQPEILCALFFQVSGPSLGLTPVSAVFGPGSIVLFPPPSGGTDPPPNGVGGEWTYEENLVGAPNSLSYGISSAGYGLFDGGSFGGSNLQGPNSVDGVQYGLTSAGDNPATGQSAVTGTNALIKNSVVLTLSGLPVGFDPSTEFEEVFWQYGTALIPTDPGFPEPATLVLLAIGGLATLRRRRRW